MGVSGCCGRTSCELVNLKCSCYDWCFFNITRFTKNHICFFKQRGNWRAKPVRSLTKIFCRVDDNLIQLHLTKYNICNCTTNPVHKLFAMMGFIIMPIDQQIGTVGENKFKGQVRPELPSSKILFSVLYFVAIFLYIFDFLSVIALTLIWVEGGNFTHPPSWFSLSNSKMVKAVTLKFCNIQ